MTSTEANPGWAAGIGLRTRVKQLAWALKGAPLRKKDLRLNALSGIAEGRKLRDRVTALMSQAGADPADAMVFCVFAEPDLSAPVSRLAQLDIANGALDITLASQHSDKLPVGFLVYVYDRHGEERSIFGHARPLIVEDPRGPEFNERALQAYGHKIKAQLMQAGEIPDERN